MVPGLIEQWLFCNQVRHTQLAVIVMVSLGVVLLIQIIQVVYSKVGFMAIKLVWQFLPDFTTAIVHFDQLSSHIRPVYTRNLL